MIIDWSEKYNNIFKMVLRKRWKINVDPTHMMIPQPKGK